MDVVQRKLDEWEMVDSRLDALFVMKDNVKERQRDSVLNCIKGCLVYGATDEEIATTLDMRVSSVCARRNEIVKKFPGTIFVAGKRKASSGIFVDVWKYGDGQ